MVDFFNTLSRKVETFKPIKDNYASIYSCGPTVYNFPHIGNYRAYVFVDLLKRYLLYNGFKVKHVMNITDVDDKTIRDSQKEGVSLTAFTQRYEVAFLDDLKSLNILPANVYPRATEYIDSMAQITADLVKKGFAYKGEDGSIYFAISKFKDYGKLANLNLKQLKAGASGRMKKDEYTKDDLQDFALWKSYDSSDGEVFWETEVGKGRPGWHIECTAMSIKNLGPTFDIHCGGIDLVFPHHQNEIAQSEAWTGKKFVNYWLHNEWLLVNGQKMSKSLGNFFTLRDILAKGYSSVAIRYLLLSTHYRQQLNFTFDGIDAAAASIERLNELIRKLIDVKNENERNDSTKTIENELNSHMKIFEAAMDNDLNISEALASIFDLVKTINSSIDSGMLGKTSAKTALDFLKKVDTVLGVMNFSVDDKLPKDLQALVDERELLRKQKKFAESDKIRKLLLEKGVQLDDTASGLRWKRV